MRCPLVPTRSLGAPLAVAAVSITALAACGAVRGATKAGMTPILVNGIAGFVSEPDLAIAEGAILANMKLIEAVVATYPDDTELLLMAAMARANYAFGFVQDELEAVRIAYPADRARARALATRVLASYGEARRFAERALAENDDYAERLAGRTLESLSQEELGALLELTEEEDAEALFWLAFAWGGSMQVTLDPAEATQLPKVEALVERVLALDPSVFYALGPEMLAGALHGFRSPALGGNPEKAIQHFDRAKRMGGVLIPDVLKAQFVYAQTERQAEFESTLEAVIAAEPRRDRALLEVVAKRKACRLLANIDQFFLTDPRPPPEACERIPFAHPLRETPLEPADAAPAAPPASPEVSPADPGAGA